MSKHLRYNHSEKGRARNRRYWDSRGQSLRQARSADAQGDWSFTAYLRGEMTWEKMLQADPLPKLSSLRRAS